MRITFLDVNASYAHSSLALPMLANACEPLRPAWAVVRGTRGDDPGDLARQVANNRPDAVLATLYLFTHEAILKILSRAAVLCPDAVIILGGPEFLGDNEPFLRRNPFVNAVVRGPGETALPRLLADLNQQVTWQTIPGVSFRSKSGVYNSKVTAQAPWPPATLPVDSPLFDWSRPFIQVEGSRGCNQRCGFCTSANTGGADWLPLKEMRRWLEAARARGIQEIRMLDRTFNGAPAKAAERLQMCMDEFPEHHIHLEIHPAFLPRELRDLLGKAPAGQFHLEVGLQSTHADGLAKSGRTGTREVALDGLSFLCASKNLQVHVDLISGLPGVTYDQLLQDIKVVLDLEPDEIQLETLKILPGTPFELDAQDLGLVYAPDPPYEVLATRTMNADEVHKSRLLSRLIDRFYNHPMLQPVFLEVFRHDSTFLGTFLETIGSHLEQLMSLRRRALLLFDSLQTVAPQAQWCFAYQWLKYGFSPHQCPIKVPRWRGPVPPTAEETYRGAAYDAQTVQTWLLETPEVRHFFMMNKKVIKTGPVAIWRETKK